MVHTSTSTEVEYRLILHLLEAESDDELKALQVAIYLEGALGLVLPDAALDWQHLGTWSGVQRTMADFGGG